jgi:hypothetical protein
MKIENRARAVGEGPGVFRTVLLACASSVAIANCMLASAPEEGALGEGADEILDVCPAAGVPTVELAQASADLCAPFFHQGANVDTRTIPCTGAGAGTTDIPCTTSFVCTAINATWTCDTATDHRCEKAGGAPPSCADANSGWHCDTTDLRCEDAANAAGKPNKGCGGQDDCSQSQTCFTDHLCYTDGNLGERECVYDRNDTLDTTSALTAVLTNQDGDIDWCKSPAELWDDADISGLATASSDVTLPCAVNADCPSNSCNTGTHQCTGTGSVVPAFWAINDAGSDDRKRCGGSCAAGEDVPDPLAGNPDCNGGGAGFDGQEMLDSKWIYLVGGNASMQKLGQTLLVGGAGTYDLEMDDPEAMARYTRAGGSSSTQADQRLLVVDGGLDGASPDKCNPRGACRGVSVVGGSSPAACALNSTYDAACSAFSTMSACIGTGKACGGTGDGPCDSGTSCIDGQCETPCSGSGQSTCGSGWQCVNGGCQSNCAWIEEPPDNTKTGAGSPPPAWPKVSRKHRYQVAVLPEPNPQTVAANAALASPTTSPSFPKAGYNTVCVQSSEASPVKGASWIYFDLPTTGCGGGACPPETAMHAAAQGLANIEGAAVVPEWVASASAYKNSLVLFAKSPYVRTPARCGNGGTGRLYSGSQRIDQATITVYKIKNIDQYLESGGTFNAGQIADAGTAEVVTTFDMETTYAYVTNPNKLRMTDAAFVPDTTTGAANAGWLLFASKGSLYKRYWQASPSTSLATFLTGFCAGTMPPLSSEGEDCANCMAEPESMAARLTAAGSLVTYHAGESAHKADADGDQQPAPLARVSYGPQITALSTDATVADAALSGYDNASCGYSGGPSCDGVGDPRLAIQVVGDVAAIIVQKHTPGGDADYIQWDTLLASDPMPTDDDGESYGNPWTTGGQTWGLVVKKADQTVLNPNGRLTGVTLPQDTTFYLVTPDVHCYFYTCGMQAMWLRVLLVDGSGRVSDARDVFQGGHYNACSTSQQGYFSSQPGVCSAGCSTPVVAFCGGSSSSSSSSSGGTSSSSSSSSSSGSSSSSNSSSSGGG